MSFPLTTSRGDHILTHTRNHSSMNTKACLLQCKAQSFLGSSQKNWTQMILQSLQVLKLWKYVSATYNFTPISPPTTCSTSRSSCSLQLYFKRVNSEL